MPNTPNPQRLCKDCRHSVPHSNSRLTEYILCSSPDAPVSLVTGLPKTLCADMRKVDRHCGPSGALFEPRTGKPVCATCHGTGEVRAPYSRDLTNCPDCRSAPISSASVATVESENPAGNKA